MDKNNFIENVLNVSGQDYVVWDVKNEEDGKRGIPHRVYTFMESFYQTLDYKKILNDNSIVQVESALGVCNLLIPGDERIYVTWPYLAERMSTADFFANLINNNLPIEYDINVFYYSLPTLMEEKKQSLRELLELGIGLCGYQEIKQNRRMPTQEHLHNQFERWKKSEEAYAAILKAEDGLYQALQKGNPIAMDEAEEEYVSCMEKIEDELDEQFLKENLEISNGAYQRCCTLKTKQFNQVASIYYQFGLEIQKVKKLRDAIALQKKMYHTYRRVAEQFDYEGYPYFVQQAFQYIHNHWREKISLSDIADALAINKCYLSTSFNEVTGLKITDYIQKLKIDWAEILLQSTTLKVVDVAFLCGFEDASYFGKIYKKLKGITPQKARENKQAGA